MHVVASVGVASPNTMAAIPQRAATMARAVPILGNLDRQQKSLRHRYARALGRKDYGKLARGLISRPRVLVVEDDAPLAHLYCTALTLNGLSVMRAADGLTALRVVEDYRPDVVVLDLMLPQIDGWAVLREFHSRPSTRSIPVIVVTGAELSLEIAHAKAVIRKPVDPDYIAAVVTRHLPALGKA